MKNVRKSPEPEELKNYKDRFSSQFKRWRGKKNKNGEKEEKGLTNNSKTLNAIRNNLVADQKGLCAYCEMALHENNRSVEHFIPCRQSTKENNYDLDWQNMLGICRPPGGVEDDHEQNSKLLKDSLCCGLKKGGIIDGKLLNPLNLPTSRLFKFSSKDGEIRPDEIACLKAGIPVKNVEFTIEQLGLNVPRLKDQRLAVIDEINKELDDETIDINDLEEKIAVEYFGDGTENWPRFFTTMRWVLGAGAEKHLENIFYSG